jgi:hypothetical protein
VGNVVNMKEIQSAFVSMARKEQAEYEYNRGLRKGYIVPWNMLNGPRGND